MSWKSIMDPFLVPTQKRSGSQVKLPKPILTRTHDAFHVAQSALLFLCHRTFSFLTLSLSFACLLFYRPPSSSCPFHLLLTGISCIHLQAVRGNHLLSFYWFLLVLQLWSSLPMSFFFLISSLSFPGFSFTLCSFDFCLKIEVFWVNFVSFFFVFNHWATELLTIWTGLLCFLLFLERRVKDQGCNIVRLLCFFLLVFCVFILRSLWQAVEARKFWYFFVGVISFR